MDYGSWNIPARTDPQSKNSIGLEMFKAKKGFYFSRDHCKSIAREQKQHEKIILLRLQSPSVKLTLWYTAHIFLTSVTLGDVDQSHRNSSYDMSRLSKDQEGHRRRRSKRIKRTEIPKTGWMVVIVHKRKESREKIKINLLGSQVKICYLIRMPSTPANFTLYLLRFDVITSIESLQERGLNSKMESIQIFCSLLFLRH